MTGPLLRELLPKRSGHNRLLPSVHAAVLLFRYAFRIVHLPERFRLWQRLTGMTKRKKGLARRMPQE